MWNLLNSVHVFRGHKKVLDSRTYLEVAAPDISIQKRSWYCRWGPHYVPALHQKQHIITTWNKQRSMVINNSKGPPWSSGFGLCTGITASSKWPPWSSVYILSTTKRSELESLLRPGAPLQRFQRGKECKNMKQSLKVGKIRNKGETIQNGRKNNVIFNMGMIGKLQIYW